MTLKNTNFGSEYGVECQRAYSFRAWNPLHLPGKGYETYEEAYQIAIEFDKVFGLASSVPQSEKIQYRVVVYDYDDSKRKNIRILTMV